MSTPPSFDPLRFVQPSAVQRSARAKPRAARIAELAYFKAEKRGFAPGHAEEDWLEAEAEVDAERSRNGE